MLKLKLELWRRAPEFGVRHLFKSEELGFLVDDPWCVQIDMMRDRLVERGWIELSWVDEIDVPPQNPTR